MAWVEQPTVFDNAEFENANKTQPWVPKDWTLQDSNTRWEYAAFDGYAAGGTERFESGFGWESWEEGYEDWRHKTPDRSDMSSYDIDTQANCIITANSLKAMANLHFPDTDYHEAADGRTIAAADATDLSSLLTLVNELVLDCQAHSDDPSTTWHSHKGHGWDEPFWTGTATTLVEAQLFLLGLIVGFGRHLWWRGNRVRWTGLTLGGTNELVALFAATVDPDITFVSPADNFDDYGSMTQESYEDYEEGWESDYLSGAVQTALGTNENRATELTPTPAAFSQGDEFDSFDEAWNDPRHKAPDESDVSGQDFSDQAKAIVVANYFKGIANAHFPSTTYHISADSRTIAAADAYDLTTLLTLVNEMYTDCRTHALDAGLDWHRKVTDSRDVPDSATHPATDLDEAKDVLAVIVAFFGRHLRWDGNELNWTEFTEQQAYTNFGGDQTWLARAEFDTSTPEEWEDFEEEWNGNEGRLSYFTIPTNLVLGSFEEGSADSFEASSAFGNEPTAAGNYSDELVIEPSKSFYFWTSGTFVATFELQVQRNLGGTWITILEFTDNTTPLEIPAGYAKARIYCSSWTSGPGVSCFAGWERLDLY